MKITDKEIKEFERYLIRSERESTTIKQYTRAIERLMLWLDGRTADKNEIGLLMTKGRGE